MSKYRALVGISYTDKDGKPKRLEAGKTAELPPKVVAALSPEQIEEVK